MSKFFDNGPAIDALRNAGFRFEGVGIPGIRDGFQVKTQDGRLRRLKIHKSGVVSGLLGRHRFGISVRSFSKVDDIVLWARGEKVVLIVPASQLADIHQSGSSAAQESAYGNWGVNVYFEMQGKQKLVPCNFRKWHDLTSFAHPVSGEPH